MYQSLEQMDKEKLQPVEEIIRKVLKDGFQIRYLISPNHRAYMQIELDRFLLQKEKTLLLKKVKKGYYHIEMIEKNKNTIVEIYNENVL